MKYIKIKKAKNRINFYWTNKVYLGYAYMQVDGYYVFSFEGRDGVWSDYVLTEIADILTALNYEWNQQIITNMTY